MCLGQPDVQRQQARLGAEAEEREQKGDRSPRAGKNDRAHRAKGVVAAAALKHAEAQQDGNGADMRDQQVEESRTPDFGKVVIGGHQKVGRERHGLPRKHEDVGVVGDEHQRHGGEEGVILETQQSRRAAFAVAKVAGGKDGNAGGGHPEQQQEKRRQGIQPQMKRQVGQAQRQHDALGDLAHRHERDDGEQQTDAGSDNKQQPDDASAVAHAEERQHPYRQPGGDGCDDDMKRAEHCYLSSVTMEASQKCMTPNPS